MDVSSANLCSLPLEKSHERLGAKMVPFGGWRMPIQYPTGIIAEHHHTRTEASLFDCSHMGQFRIRGDSATRDLDALLPRLVSPQSIGSCRYNLLLSPLGTIYDDLIVYRLGPAEYYVVVNAATCAHDGEYIRAHLAATTEFIDESSWTAKLDIQGPKAAMAMTRLGVSVGALPTYYRCAAMPIGGISTLVSRTGYTGELGFEIYLQAAEAQALWERLLAIEFVKPAGLGARDTLRLEVGYPLYGHELSDKITPAEAGLEKLIDMQHEFVGKAHVGQAPERKLTGVLFDGRQAARDGAALLDEGDRQIGVVTSGSFSPTLKKAIALAYIDRQFLDSRQPLFVRHRENRMAGSVVDLPFYKEGTVRQALDRV